VRIDVEGGTGEAIVGGVGDVSVASGGASTSGERCGRGKAPAHSKKRPLGLKVRWKHGNMTRMRMEQH
jgi:hypothetical protein